MMSKSVVVSMRGFILPPKTVVPMESMSLRSYSDAYPCHRVPTHGLISVI